MSKSRYLRSLTERDSCESFDLTCKFKHRMQKVMQYTSGVESLIQHVKRRYPSGIPYTWVSLAPPPPIDDHSTSFFDVISDVN